MKGQQGHGSLRNNYLHIYQTM